MGRLEVEWTLAAQVPVEKVTHLLKHEFWVRLPYRTKLFSYILITVDLGLGVPLCNEMRQVASGR